MIPGVDEYFMLLISGLFGWLLTTCFEPQRLTYSYSLVLDKDLLYHWFFLRCWLFVGDAKFFIYAVVCQCMNVADNSFV